MAWLQGPLRTDKACSVKINLVGLGPCWDTVFREGGRWSGNRTDKNQMFCWLQSSEWRDRFRSALPCPDHSPHRRKAKRKSFFFWQIKVPLPITISIPKLNGIAAIMYGWHYLHVLVVLYIFFFSRTWWTLRGKTEANFSILLSAASWGGANSCSGAAMYK